MNVEEIMEATKTKLQLIKTTMKEVKDLTKSLPEGVNLDLTIVYGVDGNLFDGGMFLLGNPYNIAHMLDTVTDRQSDLIPLMAAAHEIKEEDKNDNPLAGLGALTGLGMVEGKLSDLIEMIKKRQAAREAEAEANNGSAPASGDDEVKGSESSEVKEEE
jgi:hypothetical protein